MSARPSVPQPAAPSTTMTRTYAAVLAVEGVVVGLLWALQQIFA